ncbi:hypothetical protein [Alishewanella longhuensis]
MLSYYRRLAKRLNPFRGLFVALAVVVAAGFALILFFGNQTLSEQWLLPLLVSLIFLLCLLLMLFLFSAAEKQLAGRISRFFYWLWQWLLTLLLSALLLLWFFLFLRALSAIIRQLW